MPFPVPGMGWERRFFGLNICVNEMGEDACISTVEVIKISLRCVSPFQKRRRKKNITNRILKKQILPRLRV